MFLTTPSRVVPVSEPELRSQAISMAWTPELRDFAAGLRRIDNPTIQQLVLRELCRMASDSLVTPVQYIGARHVVLSAAQGCGYDKVTAAALFATYWTELRDIAQGQAITARWNGERFALRLHVMGKMRTNHIPDIILLRFLEMWKDWDNAPLRPRNLRLKIAADCRRLHIDATRAVGQFWPQLQEMVAAK